VAARQHLTDTFPVDGTDGQALRSGAEIVRDNGGRLDLKGPRVDAGHGGGGKIVIGGRRGTGRVTGRGHRPHRKIKFALSWIELALLDAVAGDRGAARAVEKYLTDDLMGEGVDGGDERRTGRVVRHEPDKVVRVEAHLVDSRPSL